MNTISIAEETDQPRRIEERDSENDVKQAKITGLLCMAFALAAIGLGVFSAKLYFASLFLAAACGLFGYSEIGIVKKGFLGSAFLLLSSVLLILLFLFLSGSVTDAPFLTLYVLFSILIPLSLTILALATNKVEIWKSLIPLLIPAFNIFGALTINSKISLLGFMLVPLGWGLLGFTAYLGRK